MNETKKDLSSENISEIPSSSVPASTYTTGHESGHSFGHSTGHATIHSTNHAAIYPASHPAGQATTGAPVHTSSQAGQLGLILWKNLILRRRHYVLTVLEFAIPMGLMALIVYLRSVTNSNFLPVTIDNVTTFDPVPELNLQMVFCRKSFGIWDHSSEMCHYRSTPKYKRKLFWGPKTNFTLKMIRDIQKEIYFCNRFLVEVDSKEEMDSRVQEAYLHSQTTGTTGYYFGIFFNLAEEHNTTIPFTLDYELRFQKYWFSEYRYPFFQLPGPRDFAVFGLTGNYVEDGFVLLQTVIDRAFMKIIKGSDEEISDIVMSTQLYPYPPYVNDFGLSQLYAAFLPPIIVLSFVLLSPTLIKSIVSDKETGVRELMRVMGVEGWVIWFGWFLYSFFTVFIVCIAIAIALKIDVTAKYDSNMVIPPILSHSSPSLVFFIMILYGISSICFCLAISCFFNKPTLATTLGVLIWLISYYVPSHLVDSNYIDMCLATKLLCCTLPNVALKITFKLISMFEGRALGIQWSNMWSLGNSRDNITVGMVIIMYIVDIVFYVFLIWYVDRVMPGKYGVAKPWYFVFENLLKINKKAQHPFTNTNYYENIKINSAFIESEPSGLRPGIKIRGLRKVFKSLNQPAKIAVDDVNLTCYEGQCTVLLGHNGAGKTITMSIITGLYSSTSGYVEVNGWNIKTNLKEGRSSVGLCPQHNTLFSDLTVEQHLLFFAQLKGLSKNEAQIQANILLQRLHLLDKKHKFGKQLSGGMKRKLCLSIALIGGSNIIILDEPSSGLDPESRRSMWDVIQEERGTRTVLLTTHHLEEADVLGDRVAIMSDGQVVCSGSSLFLKNTFGDGYTLSVIGQDGTDVNKLVSIIKYYLSEAVLQYSDGFNYNFKLPNETNMFPILLDHLSQSKQDLKIDHFGLSMATLEQVFLKVGEISKTTSKKVTRCRRSVVKKYEILDDSAETGSIEILNEDKHKINSSMSYDVISAEDAKLEGYKLLRQRFLLLLKKKFIYSKRKWILFITQAIIPVLITILCLIVDSSFSKASLTEPAVELNLNMFDFSYSTLECHALGSQDCPDNLLKIVKNYYEMFKDPHEVEYTKSTTTTLIDASIKDLSVYRENYITSLVLSTNSLNQTVTNVMYQSIPYHAAGIGINILDNAILHSITNIDYNIVTHNSPLPPKSSVHPDNDSSAFSAFLYAMVMPVALCFLTSSFLVFPLQERISKAKQIQLMTGTPAKLLWCTTYMFDLLSYSLTALLMFSCFMIFDTKDNFTANGAPVALMFLILLYGIASIPMAYSFSYLYNSAASGFAVLTLINILAGLVVSLTTLILQTLGSDHLIQISYYVGNFTSLIPSYPVSKAFMGIVDTSNSNQFCDLGDPGLLGDLCEQLHAIQPTSKFLVCCPEYCEMNGNCFKPLSYFEWTYPGIGEPLTYLTIDLFLFFFIVWMLEIKIGEHVSGIVWRIIKKFHPHPEIISDEKTDCDVIREKQIAEELMNETSLEESSVVVHDLRKTFERSGFTAVNGISFSVKKGECFGLLGVNGAGKTTTFRMLTGDEIPSSGNVRIKTNYLTTSSRKFMKNIGYCPQFDAIIGELTGEEMMTLIAGLRGVDSSNISFEVWKLINHVDLTECAQRQSSTYSGGNKRKLSAAMALIGRPPVVLLDEPTAGVDPVSRRCMWGAIRNATSNGQSVILTSHSMDECEALCSKIVIMAKGVLKCAGTPMHLKAKFGEGHQLHIKLKTSLPKERFINVLYENDEVEYKNLVRGLKEIISLYFNGSILEDEHRGMLSFRIPSKYSWSRIFTIMEALKTGELARDMRDAFCLDERYFNRNYKYIVEDYVAMDTSLEQVFLSFAKEDSKDAIFYNTPAEMTKF